MYTRSDKSQEAKRTLPRVSKAKGGLLLDIDITKSSEIQEMADLEYVRRMERSK